MAAVGAAAYFTVFSLATLAAFGYRIAGTLLTPLVIGDVFRKLVVDLFAGFRDPPVLPVLFALRRNHDLFAGIVLSLRWFKPAAE